MKLLSWSHIVGLGCVLASAVPAQAGQVTFGSLLSGQSGIAIPVQSFSERRFSSTIEQQFDFSCGSAALATLLTFSYDDPVTEQQVFTGMFRHGNPQLIETSGFSLLDMKNYLARHGYESAGFRAPLAKLAQVSLPAIVLINESGYNHFVVVRGFHDGDIILSDPAVGLKVESIKRFENQWSGIFFLILTDASKAQHKFLSDKMWQNAPEAPIQLARFAISLATLEQVTIRNAGSF